MLVLAGALNGALGNVVGATGLFVGRLFLRQDWSRHTTVGTLALTQTLRRCLALFADRPTWARMQSAAMKSPVGWETSSRTYAALYADLLT